MEARVEPFVKLETGFSYDRTTGDLIISLSQQRKIRVIGFDEPLGKTREYFLKVTERKGLVLV